MKRLLALVLSLLLLFMVMTGCGSSTMNGGAAEDSMAPGNAATDGGWSPEYDYSKEEGVSGSVSEMPSLNGNPESGAGNPLENAKIIYTGDLTLQTTSMDDAAAALAQLVSNYGGYFESQEVYLERYSKDAYYVVRIPGDSFYDFLNSVSATEVYTVTYRNVTSENVGEAYADIENRLETLNIKLNRLQSLLEQAVSMEDIITIDSAISEVEYMIEMLSGEKRHYDSLINYSTVRISMYEVSVASEGVDPTLGERISSSFYRGIEDFVEWCEDFLVWLVGSWIGLLIFAVIIVVVITFLRKAKKKGPRRKRTPVKEEPKETE